MSMRLARVFGFGLAAVILVSGEGFAQRPEGGPNRGRQGGRRGCRYESCFNSSTRIAMAR